MSKRGDTDNIEENAAYGECSPLERLGVQETGRDPQMPQFTQPRLAGPDEDIYEDMY